MNNNKFWLVAIIAITVFFMVWVFYLVPKWTENVKVSQERQLQSERVQRYEDYLVRRGYIQ